MAAARPFVVVGASLAGLRAAQAIRAGGHDGALVIVGEEPHLPYTRPPLSKELLAGAQTAADCAFPCDELDAEWRLGVRASGLDPERRELRLADGERLPYTRVVLATGSRARPFPGRGADLPGVFTLRTLDDAAALGAALAGRPRLAIVGAGFVGCEVAASARGLGLDVTLIDVAATPMVPLGTRLGERLADMHRAQGVELRLGVGVAALEGVDRLEAVALDDGSRVEADVALVALGALPNTEWLAGTGLADARGVECDATLTTASPDVLAAGDVASWPHALADGERIRVEHWTNAAEQGTAAGRNALLEPDERRSHDAIPSFWSDQYGTKIQAVGLPGRADQLRIVEADADGQRLVALGERDGRIVAAVGFSAARRLPWYRAQIAGGATPDEVVAALAADERALGPAPAGALA